MHVEYIVSKIREKEDKNTLLIVVTEEIHKKHKQAQFNLNTANNATLMKDSTRAIITEEAKNREVILETYLGYVGMFQNMLQKQEEIVNESRLDRLNRILKKAEHDSEFGETEALRQHRKKDANMIKEHIAFLVI